MSYKGNSLANLSPENKEFYEKALIKRLTPELVYYKFAQKKPMPKRSGQTISLRKFNALKPATTPLVEGETPAGSKLTMTEIKATVKQYGDFITISDVVDMTGIDPVLTEGAEVLGEQAGLTLDTLTRDVIIKGTTVIRPSGRATKDAITKDDKLTFTDVKKAVRILKNSNVKKIDGYYVGVIDPDTSYDLQEDKMFIDVSKYNGGQKLIDGEIGKMAGVRFIETTNVNNQANTSGVQVHDTIIFGKDAYGTVELEGKKSKPEIIIKPMGSSGTEDPLNQRGSEGWKALNAFVRINEEAIVRIEHACSE